MADVFNQDLQRGRLTSAPYRHFGLDSWYLGQDTERANGRTPHQALPQTYNVELGQDGVVQPRPKLGNFGDGTTPGSLLGRMAVIFSDGAYKLIGCFKTNANVVKISIKNTEDADWVDVDLGDWQNTAFNPIDFSQSGSTVIVTGGDKRSDGNSIGFIDLDADSLVVDTPQKVDALAGFQPSRSHASSVLDNDEDSPFYYYYGVTAETKYGETPLSAIFGVQVDKTRELWQSGPHAGLSDFVHLDWSLPYMYAMDAGARLLRIDHRDPANTDEPFGRVGTDRALAAVTGLAFFGGYMVGVEADTNSSGRKIIRLRRINQLDPSDTSGDFGIYYSDTLSSTYDNFEPVGISPRQADGKVYILMVSATANRTSLFSWDGQPNSDLVHKGLLPPALGSNPAGLAINSDGELYTVYDPSGSADWYVFRIDPDNPANTNGDFGNQGTDIDRFPIGNADATETERISGFLVGGLAFSPDGVLYGATRSQLIVFDTDDTSDSFIVGALPTSEVSGLVFSEADPPPFHDIVSYKIYGGERPDVMGLLQDGIRELNYTDRGVKHIDYSKLPPVTNSTGFPDVKYSTVHGERVFLLGDRDNPGRLWHGGIDYPLRFATSLQSNFIDVSRSKGEEVIAIEPLTADDSNRSAIAVFVSQGGYGRGRRHTLSPYTYTRPNDGLVVNTYSPTEAEKTATNAPYGVVSYQGNLYYPSLDGFKTTGPKGSAQNIVLTDEISQTIRYSYLNLDYANVAKTVGVAFQNKLYFAIPVSTGTPDCIWVHDLTQGIGSWMIGWDVPSDFILTYPDSTGRDSLLVVKDSTIKRFVADSDENFRWFLKSSQLHIGASKINKSSLQSAYFKFYNLVGTIRITIWGRTEDSVEEILGEPIEVSVDDLSLGITGSAAAWSKSEWSRQEFGFASAGRPEPVPSQSEPAYYIVPLNGSVVQWVGFTIESAHEDTGSYVTLAGFDLIFGDSGPTNIGVEAGN